VSFSIQSDEPVQTAEWFFGDGQSATGATVVHTYGENGDFEVTLVGDGVNFTREIEVPVRGDPDGGPDPFGDRCVPNEGQTHVPDNTVIEYDTNPPASGTHYSSAGFAPVAAGVYEEELLEGQWVHNLEHGYIVLLYDCDGDCEQSLIDDLEALFDAIPSSGFGNKKFVATRYAGLAPAFMAISWDVQRDFDSLDTDGIIEFYELRVDTGPEALP